MKPFIILITIYLAFMVGHHLGCIGTGYVKANGLWGFVPFRIKGWVSQDGKSFFPMNWIWDKLDFSKKENLIKLDKGE